MNDTKEEEENQESGNKRKEREKKGKTLHGLVWDDIYVESKRSENEKFYALYPTHM